MNTRTHTHVCTHALLFVLKGGKTAFSQRLNDLPFPRLGKQQGSFVGNFCIIDRMKERFPFIYPLAICLESFLSCLFFDLLDVGLHCFPGGRWGEKEQKGMFSVCHNGKEMKIFPCRHRLEDEGLSKTSQLVHHLTQGRSS